MAGFEQRGAGAEARGLARLMAVVLGLAGLTMPAAFADGPAPKLSPELARVRDQLAKYKDPVAAVHDGYHSTLGCVYYADGGMGIHFLNTSLISPKVDPGKPQILVYEPVGDKLELVAAEWLVPLATGIAERPALFGRPFDGPMKGHEPLMPKDLHHYDLHVWLFKDNPKGTFAVTNPRVSCANYGYSFLEKPPPIVAQKKAQ